MTQDPSGFCTPEGSARTSSLETQHNHERYPQKTTTLLLGYQVYDWDFRVLFKGLVQATGESRFKRTPKSVSMQITPEVDDDPQKRAEIKTYLTQFFEQSHFSVFWGDMAACVTEVYKRWKGS